ncbi:MAG TPA: DUF4282 domain-containing protein [Conexibacter sp.]|nr:DUF4282 domain-containing protein [Conexibacter sp.]
MQKGFLGSLFDLSFTSFVTTKLIKVLYVLSLVLLAIGYVVIAIACFSSGGDSVTVNGDGTFERNSGGNTGLGLLWLFVIGPILLFFYVLLYRVFFELVVVLFRIFENSRDQLAVTRAAWPSAAASVPTPPDEQPPPPSPLPA